MDYGNYNITHLIENYEQRVENDRLLASAGVANVDGLLLASAICIAIQGLLTGCGLQLVHTYFSQPKRDTRLGQLGVLWVLFLTVLQVGLWLYSDLSLVSHHEQYSRILFIDSWIIHFSILLFQFVATPVLCFFLRRVYYIWGRNKWILGTVSTLIAVQFVLGVAYSCSGLFIPGALSKDDPESFMEQLPEQMRVYWAWDRVQTASIVTLMAPAMLLGVLLTIGLRTHRNGVRALDNALSKIAFIVCGESLLPTVAMTMCFQGAVIWDGPDSFILLRATSHVASAIMFHGLMNSLTSRDRVQDILRADPVRHLAPYEIPETQPNELSANSSTPFSPVTHPASPPLQVLGVSYGQGTDTGHDGEVARRPSAAPHWPSDLDIEKGDMQERRRSSYGLTEILRLGPPGRRDS